MVVEVGEKPVGGLTVVDARGEQVRLEGVLGEATLLIFLRHLG